MHPETTGCSGERLDTFGIHANVRRVIDFRRAAIGFSAAAILFLACGSNSPPEGTWMVDCVAVLGSPPPSAQTPLAGLPYSGVPRDKLIGELTDDELGRLCDFDQCLFENGYRHANRALSYGDRTSRCRRHAHV